MRQDQYERLQAIEEKLLDVFLDEADPAGWPGQGIKLGSMDAQTRGDLYWVRKTAASCLMLASKVAHVIGQTQIGGGTVPPVEAGDDADENSIEADVRAAEREAGKLLDELQKGTRKQAFDRRTHGKA